MCPHARAPSASEARAPSTRFALPQAQMELLVTRTSDPEPALRLTALETMVKEVKVKKVKADKDGGSKDGKKGSDGAKPKRPDWVQSGKDQDDAVAKWLASQPQGYGSESAMPGREERKKDREAMASLAASAKASSAAIESAGTSPPTAGRTRPSRTASAAPRSCSPPRGVRCRSCGC